MKQKTIAEIANEYKTLTPSDADAFITRYADDSRAGVQKLVARADRMKTDYRAELARLCVMRQYEDAHADAAGICGIDEAGRGPLAGPVVAGAVILPKDCRILYLNDSKKLSAAKREELYNEITSTAVWSVGIVSPKRIDEINILQATYEAMREAIAGLSQKPDLLFNDAVTIPAIDIPQIPIIKGDAKSVSIAAASIIAKVTRDRILCEYDKIWPEYGFAAHKGYGAASHIEAIQKYGPCPIHRRTFIGHFWPVSETPSDRTAELGSEGEKKACSLLTDTGYRILERNFRCRLGEIDIIAQKEDTLIFCEVKYRKDNVHGEPEQAVNDKKRRRICNAASVYLYRKQYPTDTPVRFDVISITADHAVHFKDAFPYCGTYKV